MIDVKLNSTGLKVLANMINDRIQTLIRLGLSVERYNSVHPLLVIEGRWVKATDLLDLETRERGHTMEWLEAAHFQRWSELDRSAISELGLIKVNPLLSDVEAKRYAGRLRGDLQTRLNEALDAYVVAGYSIELTPLNDGFDTMVALRKTGARLITPAINLAVQSRESVQPLN